MNFTQIFTLFTIIFYTTATSAKDTSSKADLDTLQLVQVVFRHGDRTPLGSYPNDLYKDANKYWPQGNGQLTEKGKDQQYDLGSFMRQRYDGFLSEVYNRKEIHVLSSDTDRTLMSAEANLVGLFPFKSDEGPLKASSGDIRSNKLNVQLIPIHTIMKGNDKLLHMTFRCAKESQLTDEFYKNDPYFQKLIEENKDFLRFVRDNAGISSDWLPDTKLFSIINSVHDPLFCQRSHNMTLPSWANSTVMNKLEQLRGITFAMASGTTELRRLKGGPLAGRLIENMVKHKFYKHVTEHKMYMHSAHDDTIAAVMSTLNIFKPHFPHYAAALIVEFHQEEEDGTSFVEFYYRNSSQGTLQNLQIPNCGSPCYLPKLLEVLQPVLPINWEEECQIDSEPNSDLNQGSNLNANLLRNSPAIPEESKSLTYVVYRPGIATMLCFLIVVACSALIWLTVHMVVTKKGRKQSYIEIA